MIIDTAFILYCLFGALRGRRKKLSVMIFRLLRMVIAVFVGVSLFKLIGTALSHLMGTFFPESLGFLLFFALPLFFLHIFKRGLSLWIENKTGRINESRWGAVVGFVNSFFVAAVLLITLALSNKSSLFGILSKDSLVMRLFTFVLNVI